MTKQNESITKITRICKWGDCVYFNHLCLGKSLDLILEAHQFFYNLVATDSKYKQDFFQGKFFVIEIDEDLDIFASSYDNYYNAISDCNSCENPTFVLTRSYITQ